MSQFFATNPASRPASGPRLEAWKRDLPADWRAGLHLDSAQKPAKDDAPDGDGSPSSDTE